MMDAHNKFNLGVVTILGTALLLGLMCAKAHAQTPPTHAYHYNDIQSLTYGGGFTYERPRVFIRGTAHLDSIRTWCGVTGGDAGASTWESMLTEWNQVKSLVTSWSGYPDYNLCDDSQGHDTSGYCGCDGVDGNGDYYLNADYGNRFSQELMSAAFVWFVDRTQETAFQKAKRTFLQFCRESDGTDPSTQGSGKSGGGCGYGYLPSDWTKGNAYGIQNGPNWIMAYDLLCVADTTDGGGTDPYLTTAERDSMAQLIWHACWQTQGGNVPCEWPYYVDDDLSQATVNYHAIWKNITLLASAFALVADTVNAVVKPVAPDSWTFYDSDGSVEWNMEPGASDTTFMRYAEWYNEYLTWTRCRDNHVWGGGWNGYTDYSVFAHMVTGWAANRMYGREFWGADSTFDCSSYGYSGYTANWAKRARYLENFLMTHFCTDGTEQDVAGDGFNGIRSSSIGASRPGAGTWWMMGHDMHDPASYQQVYFSWWLDNKFAAGATSVGGQPSFLPASDNVWRIISAYPADLQSGTIPTAGAIFTADMHVDGTTTDYEASPNNVMCSRSDWTDLDFDTDPLYPTEFVVTVYAGWGDNHNPFGQGLNFDLRMGRWTNLVHSGAYTAESAESFYDGWYRSGWSGNGIAIGGKTYERDLWWPAGTTIGAQDTRSYLTKVRANYLAGDGPYEVGYVAFQVDGTDLMDRTDQVTTEVIREVGILNGDYVIVHDNVNSVDSEPLTIFFQCNHPTAPSPIDGSFDSPQPIDGYGANQYGGTRGRIASGATQWLMLAQDPITYGGSMITDGPRQVGTVVSARDNVRGLRLVGGPNSNNIWNAGATSTYGTYDDNWPLHRRHWDVDGDGDYRNDYGDYRGYPDQQEDVSFDSYHPEHNATFASVQRNEESADDASGARGYWRMEELINGGNAWNAVTTVIEPMLQSGYATRATVIGMRSDSLIAARDNLPNFSGVMVVTDDGDSTIIVYNNSDTASTRFILEEF